MEENFNIMLHITKQGVGAVASQLKIQPIKSDNMSRWTSYTDTCKSMLKKRKPNRHSLSFKLDYFYTVIIVMWKQLIEKARKVINWKFCCKSLTRNFGKYFITSFWVFLKYLCLEQLLFQNIWINSKKIPLHEIYLHQTWFIKKINVKNKSRENHFPICRKNVTPIFKILYCIFIMALHFILYSITFEIK